MKISLDLRAMKGGVTKAMLVWEEEAKRICNKKTWAMTRSIKSYIREFLDMYIGIIGTRNNMLRNAKRFHYPFAVHGGTKAYTIKPRTKPYLRFQTAKGWVTTKEVNMPDRKGNPFFITSYKNVEQKMDRLILDGMKLK